eukprot:10715222-Heterocapsa_arctica.AAC.1
MTSSPPRPPGLPAHSSRRPHASPSSELPSLPSLPFPSPPRSQFIRTVISLGSPGPLNSATLGH